MGYKEKSSENLKVAEDCKSKNKHYNVIASRTYYSLYLRAKALLVKNGIIERIKHGEISQRLITCLMGMKVNYADLKLISNNYDKIYDSREIADYREVDVFPQKAIDNLKDAKDIMEIMDKYDA
ncbi:MAG: HEPN domain-containing protein [bacterium]